MGVFHLKVYIKRDSETNSAQELFVPKNSVKDIEERSYEKNCVQKRWCTASSRAVLLSVVLNISLIITLLVLGISTNTRTERDCTHNLLLFIPSTDSKTSSSTNHYEANISLINFIQMIVYLTRTQQITNKHAISSQATSNVIMHNVHLTLDDQSIGKGIKWKLNAFIPYKDTWETKQNLQIQESGMYFMYSQYTLQSYHQREIVQLNHSVKCSRIDKSQNGTLNTFPLLNRHVQMKSSFMSFQTSGLMGAVYLSKGDVVYPEIQNVSYIYAMSNSNYWGLSKIA